MIHKIKDEREYDIRDENPVEETKIAEKQEKAISRRTSLLRREFFKVVLTGVMASVSPGIYSGCVKRPALVEAVAPETSKPLPPKENKKLVKDFYQNFDYREHKPFAEGAKKEWKDVKAYVDSDVPLALGQTITESLACPFPIGELFTFKINNGYIDIKPVFSKGESIQKYLAGRGVNAAAEAMDLHYFALTDSQSRQTRINLDNEKLEIKGPGKDGKERIITLSRYNNGNGIVITDAAKKKVKKEERIMVSKEKIISPQGEVATFDCDAGYRFQKNRDGEVIEIKSAESLQKFFSECNSRLICDKFLNFQHSDPDWYDKLQRGDLKDLKDIGQLIDIFKNMPGTPYAISGFMKFACKYGANDKVNADEYRHPVETLKSGWGDCDDYVATNFLWAHLHGFEPRLVYITGGKNGDANHVFIWYPNKNGEIVVHDNHRTETLYKGIDIGNYLLRIWPTHKVAHNFRM